MLSVVRAFFLPKTFLGLIHALAYIKKEINSFVLYLYSI